MTWDQAPSIPTCPTCGDNIRPDVVMFEENLPIHAFETARMAAQRCDVLLSVGTSNQVWPASQLPLTTLDHGGTVIIVNPDLANQPDYKNVIAIRGKAGDALPTLVDLI